MDATNLHQGELLHMEFSFYNVTYIRGFNSKIPVLCHNTINLLILSCASKQAPIRIIRFFLTTFKSKQLPCKYIIVDKYGALEKPTDVTDLLFDDFNISLETTFGYA